MKYILVIGDGMADDGLPELGSKTPLEHANIPAMDALAQAGTLGTVLTVPRGMPPGSDTAILSIFGCDPRLHYGGRASLEAAATGINLNPGDTAYRCNMVTFEDGNMPFEKKKLLSHSAGGIEGDVSDALIRELFEAPVFRESAKKAAMVVYPGGSFRHIAVQSNSQLAIDNCQLSIVNCQLPLTPPHDHIGEQLGKLLPRDGERAKTLTELMRLAHNFLDNHPINKRRRLEGKLPANGIWFWATGVATKLPSFHEKYGKTGCIISAVPLCQGIGVLMGLDKVIVEGATGNLHTNYEGKADAAFKSLQTHDFVAIHIEAPDECTHDGDLKGKLQAIEWIDSRTVAVLTRQLREAGIDFRMLVISDHKTLMSTRGHCGDPVPFVIFDSRKENDAEAATCRLDVRAAICRPQNVHFCEENAKKGVHIEDGTKLMGMLLEVPE